jgi:uncharacterized protein YdiU (UPF0061 family)
MLREYLMGEAMFNLGIPTTRALAVVSTGEDVQRDSVLPGAILTRIASSHIRVGTFEYFSSRQDYESVQRLADYTIRRHYPDLIDRPYLEFLLAVSARQAELIARWMCVGFIHGVMNTDNVAISGETIDYGPCAFMEQYDPATVFSSIDRQGRYAFGNQPRIAQWNLTRFAETLLPLIDRDPERSIQLATTAVEAFYEQYQDAWLGMMRHKLGLACPEADDAQLALDFLDALLEGKADYILAWRNLSDAAESNLAPLRSLFSGGSEKIERWLPRWKARLTREKGTAAEIATAMRQVNPYLIARNYLVEQALEAATINHDLTPFDKLLDALSDPYSERESAYLFAKSAPAEHTASYHTFCGT